MTEEELWDIETECKEKYSSYLNTRIKNFAHYQVTHNDDLDCDLSRSEERKIRSKQKKIKNSIKKQQRNDTKHLNQHYTSKES
jgi:hypothetical protein